jgi:hypothetical protein
MSQIPSRDALRPICTIEGARHLFMYDAPNCHPVVKNFVQFLKPAPVSRAWKTRMEIVHLVRKIYAASVE